MPFHLLIQYYKLIDHFIIYIENMNLEDHYLSRRRYGESAAKATSEGLDAAGHAVGTAWAVFKIRKALNPKSVIKPSTLAKSAAKTAAAEMKAKKSK